MTATAAPLPPLARPSVYPSIGVDWGQNWVGLAVRVDRACLDAVTLARPRVREGVNRARYAADQAFAGRVIDQVETLMRRWHDAGADAAARWQVEWAVTPWRVAVEGINPTAPFHHQQRLPAGHRVKLLLQLLPGAMVYGAVIAYFPGAVIVSPAERREQAARDPLPRELQGFRPHRFGANEHPKRDRVHERDAWLTAGAAQRVRPLRVREAVTA